MAEIQHHSLATSSSRALDPKYGWPHYLFHAITTWSLKISLIYFGFLTSQQSAKKMILQVLGNQWYLHIFYVDVIDIWYSATE